MAAKVRRSVLSRYKEQHWHALWRVMFDCGHWGLAYSIKGGHPPRTAICDKCTAGKPRDEAALAQFNREQ